MPSLADHVAAAMIDVLCERLAVHPRFNDLVARRLAIIAAMSGLAPELVPSAEGREALAALALLSCDIGWGRRWVGDWIAFDALEGLWKEAGRLAEAYFQGDGAARFWKYRYDNGLDN